MRPRAASTADRRGRARLIVLAGMWIVYAPVAAVAQAPATTVASPTALRLTRRRGSPARGAHIAIAVLQDNTPSMGLAR